MIFYCICDLVHRSNGSHSWKLPRSVEVFANLQWSGLWLEEWRQSLVSSWWMGIGGSYVINSNHGLCLHICHNHRCSRLQNFGLGYTCPLIFLELHILREMPATPCYLHHWREGLTLSMQPCNESGVPEARVRLLGSRAFLFYHTITVALSLRPGCDVLWCSDDGLAWSLRFELSGIQTGLISITVQVPMLE